MRERRTVPQCGQGHDRAGPFLVYSLWFLDNAKVVTRCALEALPGVLSRFFFTYLLLSHSLCPTLVRNCDYTLWLTSLRINKWYSKISKLINGHANKQCAMESVQEIGQRKCFHIFTAISYSSFREVEHNNKVGQSHWLLRFLMCHKRESSQLQISLWPENCNINLNSIEFQVLFDYKKSINFLLHTYTHTLVHKDTHTLRRSDHIAKLVGGEPQSQRGN